MLKGIFNDRKNEAKMPFLEAYYASHDADLNNMYAAKLANKFSRLAAVTQGEITVIGAPDMGERINDALINGFLIEYHAKEGEKTDSDLLKTIKDLITAYNENKVLGPVVHEMDKVTLPRKSTPDLPYTANLKL